jgi:argininosuccinate lyase
MKLWQKNSDSLNEVNQFTVGKDHEMDAYLATFDVLGSLAHIQMLESIQLISIDELVLLSKELKSIYSLIEKGDFHIEEGVEDIRK